jgi:16S rRNA G966 N2-methylase RsmD
MPSLCWNNSEPKSIPSFWPSLRPVTSFSRSVIQSWVGPLTNKVCFEVFSGTGQLSATFSDCGALGVSLVDKELGVSVLPSDSTALSNSIRVAISDAFGICYRTRTDFDVVIADPPFSFNDAVFNSIKFLLFKLKNQTGFLVLKTKFDSSLFGSNINYFVMRPFKMRACSSFGLLAFLRLK